MKRTLLTGTALATAAMLAASPASAEIKVSAYSNFGAGFGDTDQAGGGPSRDGHAFSTNSEIHFKGSGKTDGGLQYGFTIEAEADSSDNQKDPDATGGSSGNVDEASRFISGAFGKVTLGQDDNASDKEIDGTVYGVSGQNGEDNNAMDGLFKNSSAKTENALTDGSDANMVMYQSPRIGGVQANVSYMPENRALRGLWGGNVNTSHKFEGVGIKLSATGVRAGMPRSADGNSNHLTGYTVGAALDWEGFKFEVGYLREHAGNYEHNGSDDEVFVIGAGYGQGPWSVNIDYNTATEQVTNDEWEAISIGARYNIAKGLSVTVAGQFAKELVVKTAEPEYDYQIYDLTVEMSF